MNKNFQYKPLKKTRLYEEVASQIKKTIFEGKLKPGDRLSSERDLALMFNVGRPTIREALRTLSVIGLIEINAGFKGSIVKEIDLSQYFEAMSEQFTWMIKADKKNVKEMWEARIYVELGIAHMVAKNANKNDIKILEKYITKMEACDNDINKYFSVAMDFHLKLAEFSGNKIFHFIWKMFYDICTKGYPVFTEMYPDKVSKLLECNRIMLEAIKSKDPDKIDRAMKIHIEEEITFDLQK